MMNHKVCLQRYGVRRPLKFRRRTAREDNRQAAAIVKGEKWWRGSHTRWSREGNAELLWEMFGDPVVGFGVSTASECPAGKQEQSRQCGACGWAGKRGETIGLGWCPKCRAPTSTPITCPSCASVAKLSRPAEPEVGFMVAVFACREHGEFFLNDKGECSFADGAGT